MTSSRALWLLKVVCLVLVAGCATRPINQPITQTDPTAGYRFEVRQEHARDKDNLSGSRVLRQRHAPRPRFRTAFSSSSRRTYVIGPRGNRVRLLDEVDVISGISGGSFTALAYGLYGEKLFDDYEQAFLKRNVQGEIIG